MLSGNVPAVTARFHPYEVTARDHAKVAPLCSRVPSSQDHQRSACNVYGAFSIGANHLPVGVSESGRYTSVLDSNDIVKKEATFVVAGSSVHVQQYGAHHEVGHHLGLMHRCTRRSLGAGLEDAWENWYPAQRRFSHPTAEQDRRRDGRSADDCQFSENPAAMRDIMAMGDQAHPWHAGLWLDVIQYAVANGRRYGDYTWRATVVR